MKRYAVLLFTLVAASSGLTTTAWAGGYVQYDRAARWYNATSSWHGAYQNVEWGRPVALILPPTVNMQTEYAWGVGRTRMSPINHQFARPYALPSSGTTAPTPVFPWDTTQFGIYPVRGPW
ncbi:MAG: hypothetical protein GY768_07730 [Planctomycetaceae bacterium]|nr:hypothetical protein [Planctomycetaceae bacterium]